MSTSTSTAIAILGAGTWGTTLAIHLARQGHTVRLWSHDAVHITAMQLTRFNDRYLPAIRLPDNIDCHAQLVQAVKDVRDILIAVPSLSFGDVLQALKPWFKENQRLLWVSKGFYGHLYQLLHEVVQAILGDIPMAVLSGPSFALEVAKGLPTAVIVAAFCQRFAHDLQAYFQNKHFRVYTSQDIIGVELSGAMKNVLAIAVGIIEGLGFAANTRAALMTQGLAEMLQLGCACGGQPETLMGLSGVGDLILTCTDNQSRNRRFGLALGQGQTVQSAQKTIAQTIEGIETSMAIVQRARQHALNLPIYTSIYEILHQHRSPEHVVETLLR